MNQSTKFVSFGDMTYPGNRLEGGAGCPPVARDLISALRAAA